ncbi:MAG: hypothetical protein KGL23_02775 [Acidobacteriota bacterium]|nr:hypothetical protein [Acidobacteriota bacterium]
MTRFFVRVMVSVAVSVGAVAGASTVADAVGGGYAPGSAVPAGVPGGFSSVIFASTFTAKGGHVLVHHDGAALNITVPPGSFKYPYHVALTSANTNSIRGELTGRLRGDVAIFASGFVLERRGHPLGTIRPVTLTLSGPEFKRGDVVVKFFRGRFVPLHALTMNAKLLVTLHGVTEFAVVAPKR